MPRRRLLTPAERASLRTVPPTEEERIRHYTLSESDLSAIQQRRGAANRLGYAVQMCFLRYPGGVLAPEDVPPEMLLSRVALQLHLDPTIWPQYARRAETRREHLQELQTWLGLRPFSIHHHRQFVEHLTELARQTDRGIVLARALLETLRQQRIVVPAIEVIERVCSEALTQGTRQVYQALITPLSVSQRQGLERLLAVREGSKVSELAWLRQPPGAPNAKQVLAHLQRLQALEGLELPETLGQAVHSNWLHKLSREGSSMTAQHLGDLETLRRHATLVAVALDIRETLIDTTLDLHHRLLGGLFHRAQRRHAERFQESGKTLHAQMRLYGQVGRALLEARQSGEDPFTAIEAILPWEVFTASVLEAETWSQREPFDSLALVGEGFSQLRRYTPALLTAFHFNALPAARDLLEAVETLKEMNHRQARKVPHEAPTGFIRPRWESLVCTPEGLDRRFYELCVLSELKNALRSGDVWVRGSRQFRAFEDYLLPAPHFAAQQQQGKLGLAVDTDCQRFLQARLARLQEQLSRVEELAAQNQLPEATITSHRLKVTPLVKAVPDQAETLMRQAYALLPRLRITELLLEVDGWTDFTRHFTHLKSGARVLDRSLLLTAILADGLNLGLTKMAESCPEVAYSRLSWAQAWHIREETYSAALATLVNAQGGQPLAAWWGDGSASSSDGQRFRTGGGGEVLGQVNAKYGAEPGMLFYTHLSDQYAPFHTQVIHATVRDATYVLDGLLYHDSDLHIHEHSTDTSGFTDHVFALMHLLGFRFAPRIRDLADKRLYIPGDAKRYPTLAGLIGGSVRVSSIGTHWEEILRLAASIRQGTATASLMLRKLGSYPRQNGLAVALRELGKIERTLFTLDWLQDVQLRRRVQISLNKGEARNALARAVFFNRLGELRDRRFENQCYRASGLNLVVAAIVLWNTVYLERTLRALQEHGHPVDEALLPHLSPLGWEHINLTGDYRWRQSRRVEPGKFRPLRPFVLP